MIRTKPEMLALQEDDPTHAAAAREAGWLIDEDYWWVRPLRETDAKGEPEGGFVTGQHVFAMGAEECLSFDHGERDGRTT